MVVDRDSHARRKRKWKWCNRGCFWIKSASEWAGFETGSKRGEASQAIRVFVTVVLMEVKHQVVRDLESVKSRQVKKETKEGVPLSKTISVKCEGTAVRGCAGLVRSLTVSISVVQIGAHSGRMRGGKPEWRTQFRRSATV